MNNLAKRTIFGLIFVVVMVFLLIFDKITFFCFGFLLLLNTLREFYDISLKDDMKPQRVLATLAALLSFCAVYFLECVARTPASYISLMFAVSFLLLLCIPAACIFRPDHSDHGKVAFIYTPLLYIALPIVLSPKLVMDGEIYDGWMFLSFFIVIWISDIGAYCVGTAFGQKPDSRKLAPSISPKKSWWGFWGAVVLGTAAAVGLHFLTWFPFSLVHCIVLGVIISVGAVCGDLVESLWKRYFGVKDSGNAIPGHGGFLDRFDSSLVAIPLACIYLSICGLL